MFKKLSLWLCLLVLSTIPALPVAASSPTKTGKFLLKSGENDNIVYVEYLDPIKFPELTAQPGQTVSEEIEVRVRFHKSNGTAEIRNETVTFTLSNVVDGDLATSISNSSINPRMATTYVTCYGSLNGFRRQYTAKVDWHFDGIKATHDLSTASTFSAGWPYSVGLHHPPAPGLSGPTGAPLVTSTLASFLASSPFTNKSHMITWTLPHNSSYCTAVGRIF